MWEGAFRALFGSASLTDDPDLAKSNILNEGSTTSIKIAQKIKISNESDNEIKIVSQNLAKYPLQAQIVPGDHRLSLGFPFSQLEVSMNQIAQSSTRLRLCKTSDDGWVTFFRSVKTNWSEMWHSVCIYIPWAFVLYGWQSSSQNEISRTFMSWSMA